MARNEEKNYSVLNRLLLQKEKEKREERNPKRPPLHTLRIASEVRQWIPSIKAEMDHCLHHLSGVRNYSDSKIKEFQERLALLQREHKKWVRRVLELDPAAAEGGFTPGDPHPYLSKRKRSQPQSHNTPQKGEAVEQEQQHERTVVSSQKKARTNATAITTTATARATSSMSSNSTGGIATPLLELEEEKEERQKEEARRHLEASLALDDSQNQPLSFSNHQDKLATTAQQPAEAEEGEEEETGLSLLSAYDD